MKSSYIKVVGIQNNESNVFDSFRTKNFFAENEERAVISLAKEPHIYDRLYRSIAPSIYGNEDIKKAIICCLLGGVAKYWQTR